MQSALKSCLTNFQHFTICSDCFLYNQSQQVLKQSLFVLWRIKILFSKFAYFHLLCWPVDWIKWSNVYLQPFVIINCKAISLLIKMECCIFFNSYYISNSISISLNVDRWISTFHFQIYISIYISLCNHTSDGKKAFTLKSFGACWAQSTGLRRSSQSQQASLYGTA